MISQLRVAAVVVAMVAAVAARMPPPVPVIPSTFMSGIMAVDVMWGLNPPESFEGFFATDSTAKNTFFMANESTVNINILKLYPTGTQFDYIATEEQCQLQRLNDSYFPLFSWLPLASYGGQHVIHELTTDMWSLTTPDGNMLALYSIGNTPFRLSTASLTREMTSVIDFFGFEPLQPPTALFSIPSYCVESGIGSSAQLPLPADDDEQPRKPIKPIRDHTHRSKAEKLHGIVTRMHEAVGSAHAHFKIPNY